LILEFLTFRYLEGSERTLLSIARHLRLCTGVHGVQGIRSHRIANFPAAGVVTIKDRVNAIALAPVEDFRRDSDLFGEGLRNPQAQKRFQAALKRGFQTRDAEMDMARMLGDLADR
jgi:hypothetical protein